MQLFYCEDLPLEGIATLPREESHHCVRVLRMSSGDGLMVTDGCGHRCRATLRTPDERGCTVQIEASLPDPAPRPCHLHIAVAPTKNTARIEWFVEKAVEIGIDEITPLLCDHSERTTLKADRLHKIALAAMKQSLRTTLPVINEPTRATDFVGRRDPAAQNFIAHCEGDERTPMQQLCQRGGSVTVLIGPEGDFSPREIEAALHAGFRPVTLGPSRLRTETAALYATMLTAIINS